MLGVVLVTELVAIPVIEEADARISTASDRNKGQQGDLMSNGKRQGGCGGGEGNG